MKRLLIPLLLLTALTVLAPQAYSQGSGYHDTAWKFSPGGSFTASGATITVCPSTSTGVPCAPVASVYLDKALTQLCTGANIGCLTTDSKGNFSFYIAPGDYIYTVSGTGITSYGPVPFSLGISLGASNTFTGSTTTFTNPITVGVGSASVPSYGFVGNAGQGMYYNTTVLAPTFIDGGNDALGILPGSLMLAQTGGTGFYHQTAGLFDGVGRDTGFSRPAAGVFCIDTTAVNNCLGSVRTTNLQISGTVQNVAGTATQGLTLKKGSGGGNYTTASTTYVVVDSTNLCFTVTIPTGWKLGVSFSGNQGTATAAVLSNYALTDNAACGTANAGILVEGTITATGVGVLEPIALNWVINGDGASHNVALQYKTSNGADSATVLNSSATSLPTMVFTLMPSN